MATKGLWIKCMAQPIGPEWVGLALHNFKIRYSPVGSSFEVFGSGVHVAALRHKGLWQDIFQAWKALQGVMQVHQPGAGNQSPFEGSTLGEAQ